MSTYDVYVQFESVDEQIVIAAFGNPQDPEAWPNQSVIKSDDQRWVEYERTILVGFAGF